MFESVDVERLLELYDSAETAFYVDPPYYELTQPYAVQFTTPDHERLAARLASLEGTWLLSINDCPPIRRLYPGRFRRSLKHRYIIGSNARVASSDVARELLISNRPLRRRPAP